MRAQKRPRNLLVSGILLVGLVGVLILNPAVVSDLPSRLYTAEQLAYLDYNRSIRQVAPSWDIITTEGSVQSATLSCVRENRVRASLYAHYEEQEGVSITVDVDVTYCRANGGLGNGPLHQQKSLRQVIVELKYGVAQEPGAQRVASYFPFRLTRVSKYVQGVERVYF